MIQVFVSAEILVGTYVNRIRMVEVLVMLINNVLYVSAFLFLRLIIFSLCLMMAGM
jgi:hypothetical protein